MHLNGSVINKPVNDVTTQLTRLQQTWLADDCHNSYL